jgi:histone demethylase JARID1
MSAEMINFQQLEAMSGQATALPVSGETLAQVDQLLNKNREAHRQIVSLYEGSRSPCLQNRTMYKRVWGVLDSLHQFHSKPSGILDLEKEQKRDEDWMRRGMVDFGKANAPLHILHQHMRYVESRNEHCFALEDGPHTPVEPSSRGTSTDHRNDAGFRGGESSRGRSRVVFRICRQPEAG